MEYSEMKMDCEIIVPCAQPRFVEGAKVFAPAFVDCSGKRIEEVRDLIVTQVRLVTPRGEACDLLDPYYRVMAHKPDGYGYVEAAENHFAKVA